MLRIKIKHGYSPVEYVIMLICVVGLTSCVQRTYSNQSQGENFDIRVTSNSFFADSEGQNLNGVFGDGAYFGVDAIKSEINTIAIEAVAEAMKSPLFELLKLNLK